MTTFAPPAGMTVWHQGRLDGIEEGPWTGEPDKAQWVDRATDLDCLIVRTRAGALCGYVGIPSTHRLHGADYDDVDVDVHGGLTFSDLCDEDRPEGICHVPLPGRDPNVWWLGFDCAHAFDVMPAFEETMRKVRAETAPIFASMPELPSWPGDTYKDFPYVIAEVTRLAAQLAVLATTADTP